MIFYVSCIINIYYMLSLDQAQDSVFMYYTEN